MANYLQMDGVDDKLQATNSGLGETRAVYKVLIDSSESAKEKWIQRGAGNRNFGFKNGKVNFTSLDTVRIDGVLVTNGVTPFPFGQIITIELDYPSFVNNWANLIFVDYGGASDFVKGNIYNIIYSKAGVILASYDMTKGHIQDMSGKGKHAVLTGGTWAYEGNYEIAVTTKGYTEKTAELVSMGMTNINHTYDVASDSVYATSNGGWILGEDAKWKYQLEPNTVYTIMDDALASTADGGITYSGGDISILGTGYSNGYYRIIRTGNIGKFGFYFNYLLLPRYTRPIVVKGYHPACIPRSTIYGQTVIPEPVKSKIGEYRISGAIIPIYSLASIPSGNQLRTYHPTKGIGCLELVPVTDTQASPIRINAKGTIKSIKKT